MPVPFFRGGRSHDQGEKQCLTSRRRQSISLHPMGWRVKRHDVPQACSFLGIEQLACQNHLPHMVRDVGHAVNQKLYDWSFPIRSPDRTIEVGGGQCVECLADPLLNLRTTLHERIASRPIGELGRAIAVDRLPAHTFRHRKYLDSHDVAHEDADGVGILG
jgi:hypothetical protein